jgi:hypothetical protein
MKPYSLKSRTFGLEQTNWAKEYIERRHGEPFNFLFLPKMGLLGSQAVLEKKVQF